MGAAGKNIDELLAADIPDSVSFIIQTGGAEKWRSHDIPADSLNRYSVKNGELTLLESLPQGNMGEQRDIQRFPFLRCAKLSGGKDVRNHLGSRRRKP